MRKGYFNWFDMDEKFDEKFLCLRRNYDIKVYEKKCGIFNKLKKCIDQSRCDKSRFAICERNCSRHDCPKAKSEFIALNFV